MTSLAERQFSTWFASEAFTGRGQIVDLGCFVGASTAALAAGLTLNAGAGDHSVHAYDRFVMEEYMQSLLPTVQPGETLLPVFESHIAPWKERVLVHPGDVATLGWSGAPIGYLFVDVMKSWELAEAVTVSFLPSMVPEHSLLVHQDYFHNYTGWIHLLMYRLRDSFQPEYALPDREGGSMVFRPIRSVTADECRLAADFQHLRWSEIHEAFEYSAGVAPTYRRTCIAAAKAMLFWHLALRQQEGQITLDFENPLRLAGRELVRLGRHLFSHDEELAAAVNQIGNSSLAAAVARRARRAAHHVERTVHTLRRGTRAGGPRPPFGA